MARRDKSLDAPRLAHFPPSKHTLSNGLPVVICPRPGLAWAYVAVYFGVGSRHETTANNGITHVLEHMLFRGSGNYADSTVLNAAAENCGGFLEGATYRDHLVFSTGCHPSELKDVIDIIGAIVQSPRYRGMEVEREILREELLETVDRDGRMIDLDNVAHAAVFGNHSLGLPIEGTLTNLATFTRERLEAHRHRFLTAKNAVLSVAGPLSPDQVLRTAERAFGDLPTGMPSDNGALPRPRHEPVLRYVRNTSSQVDLRLSFWAVPIGHPDYPALVLLARLLADGLASRLHAELVDRQGLAYSLHAGHTTYSDCGLFEFEVSVAPNRAADVVDRLLGFARAARRMHFSQQELHRTLRRYRYGLEFMTDDASDLAAWHGRAALFGMEADLTALYGQLTRLRVREIHDVAANFLTPERLVLTAVGELARGEWRRVQEVVRAWRA